MPSMAVTVCQPPSFLEGTACQSPSIGASQMARLGDGGNTPAGLTSACLATATARRHPMVAMNPLPSTCLIGSDSTNKLHDSRLSVCVGQPLLSLLYLLVPDGNDTSCLQPERTLITGDPVSDTAGSYGSNCPALLCPGNGHSMTSCRTGGSQRPYTLYLTTPTPHPPITHHSPVKPSIAHTPLTTPLPHQPLMTPPTLLV